MKVTPTISLLLLLIALAGCDMRSQTAKDEMEKFSGTPTPAFSPAPTEPPIDPSESVQVDLNLQGDPVSVSGWEQKKSLACTKLNPATINGGTHVVTIKGPCRMVVVNGDNNQLTIDAAITIMLNGGHNTIKYARYINGKRPIIADNGGGNTVEKVPSH